MAEWHFRPHNGHDDMSQSASAEAFEGASTKGLATDLVREGIQNILDARLDEEKPARVRLTIRTQPGPQNGWFDPLFEHLQLPDVGAPDAPTPKEPCRYLVIEDFNTTGLVGDYAAKYKKGAVNNFVNFFYNDAVTDKLNKQLGSRGVGKIVFLLASRARTLFGYTVRSSDSPRTPLLVGKTLLKFREKDGALYEPAGYFVESWPKGAARQPVSDPVLVEKFRTDFTLARTNETGLSIVVPWLDPGVTLTDLRRAVVEEYHFAILSERLIVELSDGDRIECIHADHIPDVGDDELSARVALAQYALTNPQPTLQTVAPPAGEVQKLTDPLVPESVRTAILDALSLHERVCVRCNLHIHPKNTPPVLTYCDVYFEHAENVHQRPVFVRDLLPISAEGKPSAQLRALVLIRPGPLADLLRAAEGANHTQWSPRTDNFKKAYMGRLGEIEFVSTCVNRLIEIARGNAAEPVGGISTFFFSAPLDDGGKSKNKGKNKPGEKPEKPDPPDDPPEPVGYLFTQDTGGFTIRGDPDKPPPKKITIRVAYDVIRGSPWSDYDPDDFDLRKTKGDVRVIASSADIERPEPGNRLIIKPKSPDFEVVVVGFNEQLDLIVDHRSDTGKPRKRKGEPDASQTAELHQPQ